MKKSNRIKLVAGQVWQVPKTLDVRLILESKGSNVVFGEPFVWVRSELTRGYYCKSSFFIEKTLFRSWINESGAVLLPEKLKVNKKGARP